ncbi:hypothetical protein ACP70R_007501 [Stipagrostis hirtigluma subsp. patula]
MLSLFFYTYSPCHGSATGNNALQAGRATGERSVLAASVHAALALVAAGARGDTLAQLLAFLGAPSATALADFGRRVANGVLADRSDSGGPRLLFGGDVWVDASRGGLADAFRDVAVESRTTVSWSLPKFVISFTWDGLRDDLCRLGLSLPFSPSAADLRGMCKLDDVADDSDGGPRRPTFLSKVAHKAVVKVNESGTEAAAATMCIRGGGRTSSSSTPTTHSPSSSWRCGPE